VEAPFSRRDPSTPLARVSLLLPFKHTSPQLINTTLFRSLACFFLLVSLVLSVFSLLYRSTISLQKLARLLSFRDFFLTKLSLSSPKTLIIVAFFPS